MLSWPENRDGASLGDGRIASACDRPETIAGLQAAVRERVGQGLAIYPQGGRTALDFGGAPRSPGAAIDLRGLDKVVDYPAADMTVTVEAGITLGALDAVLALQNQRLLIEAPHPDRATLGGIYATNTCGPRRFGAGRPRDQILGVSFVNAEGEVVKGGGRVVKNVAGYDFPRLLTGSMGTLGVIAQMTVKVRPRPEASAVVWGLLQEVKEVEEMLGRLNTSATRAMAVEVLSPAAASYVGVPLGLPGESWVLVVGFEDNAPSVRWQVERLKEELGIARVEVVEGGASLPLWSALGKYQALEIGAVGIVASLRPSSVAAFLGRLDEGRWAAQAHAGNGIVRAHLRADEGVEAIAGEIDGLRAFAVKDGGNLTLSRCPVEQKARLKVWGEPGGTGH